MGLLVAMILRTFILVDHTPTPTTVVLERVFAFLLAIWEEGVEIFGALKDPHLDDDSLRLLVRYPLDQESRVHEVSDFKNGAFRRRGPLLHNLSLVIGEVLRHERGFINTGQLNVKFELVLVPWHELHAVLYCEDLGYLSELRLLQPGSDRCSLPREPSNQRDFDTSDWGITIDIVNLNLKVHCVTTVVEESIDGGLDTDF